MDGTYDALNGSENGVDQSHSQIAETYEEKGTDEEEGGDRGEDSDDGADEEEDGQDRDEEAGIDIELFGATSSPGNVPPAELRNVDARTKSGNTRKEGAATRSRSTASSGVNPLTGKAPEAEVMKLEWATTAGD